MSVQRAIAAYKTERLNCAQSILRAFQPQCGIPEEAVQQARQSGGGRADEGRCGALHAALQLAGDDTTRSQVRKAFVAKTGTETYRGIRKNKALTCEQCIELAAALLTEHRPGAKKGEQADL